MLTKVLFYGLMLTSTLVAAQSCVTEKGTGPCHVSNQQGTVIHYCEDGFACLRNATNLADLGYCCAIKEVVNTPTTIATTKTTTKAPSKTCQDKVNPNTGKSDCAERKAYCQKPEYYDLMTEECPKTCNRCGGNDTSNCKDGLNPKTGTSDCPARKNLCNDPVYYDVMTRQCPKTCGRC